MSDEEDYYDEDDYIYIDEEPYSEADALAENAVQSPAWNDGFDAAVGEEDPWYDWDLLYPSDFFDEDVPHIPKCRKRGDKSKQQRPKSKGTKRPRSEASDAIPELSLGEPATALPNVVVWRSDRHLPASIPVLNHGETEKVALLKDWRDHYDDLAFFSKFLQSPPKPSKPSFAVVIERRDSYGCDRLPGGSKSRKESKPKTNGGFDTSNQPLTNGSPAISSGTQKAREAASNTKKRKKAGSNLDDEETTQEASQPPPIPKKRNKIPSNIADHEGQEQEGEEEDSHDTHLPPPQKRKPSSNPRKLEPASKAPTRGKKRKAHETEEEEEPDEPQPPAKRKAPARTIASDETVNPGRRTNRPTRTSSRKK